MNREMFSFVGENEKSIVNFIDISELIGKHAFLAIMDT